MGRVEVIREAVRDASVEEIATSLRMEWGHCCSISAVMAIFPPEVLQARLDSIKTDMESELRKNVAWWGNER